MKQNQLAQKSDLKNNSPQSDIDVGRYSDQPYSAVNSSNHSDNEAFLKAKQSENVEYISGQLQQLYTDINQHVNQKLSDIEHSNKEIADLLLNLNTQVKNVLNK